MLYTRKGDTGTSGLFGTKERFAKNDAIYDALGTLDELNSLLGFCRARALHDSCGGPLIAADILMTQECLFIVQAEIAGSDTKLTKRHLDDLERCIEEYEREFANPHSFIIPGTTELSGMLDYARAVSRRAERAVTSIASRRAISKQSQAYLNRLSSYLYAAARFAVIGYPVAERVPHYN
jgi:cob(I)alamin adenosyltransferase